MSSITQRRIDQLEGYNDGGSYQTNTEALYKRNKFVGFVSYRPERSKHYFAKLPQGSKQKYELVKAIDDLTASEVHKDRHMINTQNRSYTTTSTEPNTNKRLDPKKLINKVWKPRSKRQLHNV